MKLVTVDAVSVEPNGNGEFAGTVEFSMGGYHSTAAIHAKGEGNPAIWTWKMDAPNNLPIKLESYGDFQIFIEYPVADHEAGKAVGWLELQGHLSKDGGNAMMRKNGTAFVLNFPLNDDVPADAKMEANAREIAKGLSADVFAGAPVEVHLSDRKLNTLKVVKDR
jgi:hypothetical protein